MVPLKFGKLWAGNNAKNIRGKPDISNKCFVHSPAADMQKITFDHLKICNGGRPPLFILNIAFRQPIRQRGDKHGNENVT